MSGPTWSGSRGGSGEGPRPPERKSRGNDLRNTSVIELMLLLSFVMVVVLSVLLGNQKSVDVKPGTAFSPNETDEPMTKVLRAVTGDPVERERIAREWAQLAERLDVQVTTSLVKAFDAARRPAAAAAMDRRDREKLEAVARVLGLDPDANLSEAADDLRKGRKRLQEELHKIQKERGTFQEERDILQKERDHLQALIEQQSAPQQESTKGGIGRPSCMHSKDGDIEYLYTITLTRGHIRVESSWTIRQIAEMDGNPMFEALRGHNWSLAEFETRAMPIYNHSVEKGCRYYVLLRRGSGATTEEQDEVERFFYIRKLRG
ncbi:MAG: hypothetical protein ABT940_06735 [Alphaproteobacteria bacterium]